MREHMKDGPTGKKVFKFRLLFLHHLWLWLSIYIDDLGSCSGLWLDRTLDKNNVVAVGHERHSNWHRSGLKLGLGLGLLCWVVCGYKYNESSRAERVAEQCRCSRGGGLTTSLCTIGVEGSSAPTVMVVAMSGWGVEGASGERARLICVWSSTAPDHRTGSGQHQPTVRWN